MKSGDLLLLRGNEVAELFQGRETAIFEAVKAAYLLTEEGDAAMPNCPFLRFPGNETDRIIPKPAFLGGNIQAAGIKWIGSFPGNVKRGMERASAVLILNSVETGVPIAVMESSIISACRTAASAAMAAGVLRGARQARSLGVVGCGPINFETLRFLLQVRPEIERIVLHDLRPERAVEFRAASVGHCGGRELRVGTSVGEAFDGADIVSIATSAINPHLNDLGNGPADAVILHVSLRDFQPAAILSADNVVDDVEHACSNNTSLDLTQRSEGNRDFIHSTIGAILSGGAPPDGGRPVIFSPFGLGILDIAVAHLAYELALREKVGTIIDDFLPRPRLAGVS